LHRQPIGPLLGQQPACRAQDALAIGGCVGALTPLSRHRELAVLFRGAISR
jgi:hypothetical protein